MPLFECGGSTLLQNKQAIAKPSADTIYKASDDGYDGYEQVTVPKFATLGTKSITANGNNQSVISGNNSYSAVNVNVPAYSALQSKPLWSGKVRGNQDNNITISGLSSYSYVLARFLIEFPASGVTVIWGGSVCENADRSGPATATVELVLPVLSSTPSIYEYRMANAISLYGGTARDGVWVTGYRMGGSTIAVDRSQVHFGNNRGAYLADATAVDTTWIYLTNIYGM